MTIDRSRGNNLVVIGGGQAAAQLIEVARQEGYAGTISLVSDEALPPYQRPPLSKQYLAGGREMDWLLYRPASFYEKFDVRLHLGRRALEIDRSRRTALLDDGTRLPFDRLALATGARARRLPEDAVKSDHVFYIRTFADAERLRPHLVDNRDVVIVGAGFIGLEVAAVLVQRGHTVTLLAQQDRLLPRLNAAAITDALHKHHRAKGVTFEFACDVEQIASSTGKSEVRCKDGRCFSADLVIVGIGAVPNTELAEAAGLACDDGIVVDEFARTSDEAIVAAGDCTNHPNDLYKRRLRLETVHNAVEQGRTAGASLAGKTLPYVQAPWVWSDQYELRIQSVGIMEGQTLAVVRGDAESGRFSVFHYFEEHLIGATMINQPHVFGAARRLLNERIPLTPDEASNPNFKLETLLSSRARLDFDIPWPTPAERGPRVLAWGHA